MAVNKTPPNWAANFVRVMRYTLPYKAKIGLCVVAMIFFAFFSLAPLWLIEPLLDNNFIGTDSKYSSRDVVVQLEDGTRTTLAELLRPEESDIWDWLRKYPRLYSFLFSGKKDSQPVKITDDISINPESVHLFVEGEGFFEEGKWRDLLEAEPQLADRVRTLTLEEAPPTEKAPLWFYAALVPVLFGLKGLFGVIRQVLLAWVALNVVRDIQNELYGKILRQPIAFFHKARTGDLISRMVNDVTVLSQQIVTVLSDLIQQPIVVILAVSTCFWKDWRVALTFVVLVPALSIPMTLMSRRIRKASRKAQEKRADISSVLVETLSGAEIVKAFNMEEYEKQRYSDETWSLLKREMRIRKTRAYSTPSTEMAAAFGITAVLLITWWRMKQNPTSLPFGELALILACFFYMVKPMDRFWKARFMLGEMAEAGKRIFSVMDRKPEIADADDAIALPENWRQIKFDNISFSYDGVEPVLQDMNFEVERGQKIAVVGKTGAGKTTLLALLSRFYDPTAGAITFDGTDLRKIKIASLLSQIGIVTQRSILFNDTVAANIAYGRPDLSSEDIKKAAAAAYADEFVDEFAEGYDTIIGEMGTRLSGGQAQRLSIARAVLKNPPILILDEATASLDTASERKVQAALDGLMANRTTFAIAHRLSTIRNADSILVLHEGRIVESGKHEELYAKSGMYTQLYDAQFREEGTPEDSPVGNASV